MGNEIDSLSKMAEKLQEERQAIDGMWTSNECAGCKSAERRCDCIWFRQFLFNKRAVLYEKQRADLMKKQPSITLVHGKVQNVKIPESFPAYGIPKEKISGYEESFRLMNCGAAPKPLR